MSKIDYGLLLDAVPADSDDDDRTFTIGVLDHTEVLVVVNLARIAASELTIEAWRTTLVTMWGREQSIHSVGGVGTLTDFKWTKAASGTLVGFSAVIPVGCTSALRVRIAGTGGGATDLISVTAMGGGTP